MISIKSLYKIGHGPSSSHTMGPANAAKYFKKRFPNATSFKVILYGSLALTGKGHLTDQAIMNILSPTPTKIEWNIKERDLPHPNTMDFIAYYQKQQIGKLRFFSIGGGTIKIEGETNQDVAEPNLYKENFATDILALCKKKKISLIQYIKSYENNDFWKHLANVWNTMKEAIETGLSSEGFLPGKLHVRRLAKYIYEYKEAKLIKKHIVVTQMHPFAYAYAVSEVNASGGVVVTAPTCGASGVLPSVLRYAKESLKLKEEKILEALAVAGLIGNLARTNGSIAGAEAGCQAEVGVACAMAASAYAFLNGFNNEKIFHAAGIALEHCVGLTCDPVLGYVQIPCIERNATAAIRALTDADLAVVLGPRRIFNLDDDIKNMLRTGASIDVAYKETSIGGLARIYLEKQK